MGARLVIIVCLGWTVGCKETVSVSAKWDPINNVDESMETSTDGIEDYS